MAMWEIYGGQGKSIALQSTYEKLHQALPNYAFLSMIRYIDFEQESIFEGKQFGASTFDFKRKAFSYEKELRAFIGRWKPGVIDPNKKYNEEEMGRDCPIDPQVLVEKVVVSPRTPEWTLRLIRDATARAGFSFPVERSFIDATPLF